MLCIIRLSVYVPELCGWKCIPLHYIVGCLCLYITYLDVYESALIILAVYICRHYVPGCTLYVGCLCPYIICLDVFMSMHYMARYLFSYNKWLVVFSSLYYILGLCMPLHYVSWCLYHCIIWLSVYAPAIYGCVSMSRCVGR